MFLQVGEEIKQVLTVSPNTGKVATAYIASYDSETKVLKYFRDRSLNFNRTTYDHTDYAGISTAGRIYQFESVVGANNIEGKSSFSLVQYLVISQVLQQILQVIN